MRLMLSPTRLIGHKEWTDRKSDPRHDMNWRRARVANFTPRGDDMDINELIEFRPSRGQNVWDALKQIQDNQTAQAAAIAGLSQTVAKGSSPSATLGVTDDQLAAVLKRPDVAGAIGEATAAAQDRRARDADPATGPVS